MRTHFPEGFLKVYSNPGQADPERCQAGRAPVRLAQHQREHRQQEQISEAEPDPETVRSRRPGDERRERQLGHPRHQLAHQRQP
jgi:hypothetical protein